MSARLRSILLTVLMAFLAGLGGVWVGKAIFSPAPHPASLHEAIHRELNLTAEQRQRIDALEHDFAARRAALELEMRAANASLAIAIREEHGYGPGVTAAIERCHRVMGDLQIETMRHVFAMRAVMTPAQQEHFDRIVTSALTAEQR